MNTETLTLMQTLINVGASFEDEELAMQIIENYCKKVNEPTTEADTSEANLNIPVVSQQSELLSYHEWYLQNRGRFSSSEPKYMVEGYLRQ